MNRGIRELGHQELTSGSLLAVSYRIILFTGVFNPYLLLILIDLNFCLQLMNSKLSKNAVVPAKLILDVNAMA